MKQKTNKTKQIVKNAILVAILIGIASVSRAAEYKMFYVDNNGKQLEETKALVSAIKGETIYKCQSVEAKMNKSGTSIGVRNVKKPTVTTETADLKGLFK